MFQGVKWYLNYARLRAMWIGAIVFLRYEKEESPKTVKLHVIYKMTITLPNKSLSLIVGTNIPRSKNTKQKLAMKSQVLMFVCMSWSKRYFYFLILSPPINSLDEVLELFVDFIVF